MARRDASPRAKPFLVRTNSALHSVRRLGAGWEAEQEETLLSGSSPLHSALYQPLALLQIQNFLLLLLAALFSTLVIRQVNSSGQSDPFYNLGSS
jgi:hypothetical protein